jgi:PleD family two-component response regulator
MFRLEARTAERSGQSVFICLVTISANQGQMPAKDILLGAMEKLKEVISRSLRKGDVFSRFSAAQYILMLPTTSYENGERVLGRILDNFRKTYRNPTIKVKVTLEPISPAV